MRAIFSGTKPCRLDRLDWPAGLRAAVLAPHPDDFDAIGVTMRLLHRHGHRIHLAVLSACSGVEDSFCSTPTPQAKAALREEEQRQSCRFFGLPDDGLEFPRLKLDQDGQPAETDGNAELLRQILERSQADLVFLPHGNDTNSGHRQTWGMFRRIAPALGRPITAFYNHDPKTVSLRVDALTLFDESAATWKAELLRFHHSQQHRNLLRRGRGLDERILEDNRRLAAESGFSGQYVEAFEMEWFGPEAGMLRRIAVE